MVRYYIMIRRTHGDCRAVLIPKRELEDYIQCWRNNFQDRNDKTSRVIKQKVTWIDGVKTIEETDVTENI